MLLFLVLPLAAVFAEALRKGFGAYLEGLREPDAVSYTHLRAHETVLDLVCRLLLEKKKDTQTTFMMKMINKQSHTYHQPTTSVTGLECYKYSNISTT